MNTYRIIPNTRAFGGIWAVEWPNNGVVSGIVTEDFETEAQAAFRAYELARVETEKDGSEA